MSIDKFSILNSVLFFNLFILIVALFRKNNRFILNFSSKPILFLLSLCILRLMFPLEIGHPVIIDAPHLLNPIVRILNHQFTWFSLDLKVSYVFLYLWMIVASFLLIKDFHSILNFKKYFNSMKKIERPDYQKVFTHILKENTLTNKIQLFIVDEVKAPMVKGGFTGKVYLPNMDFTKNELRYIFEHEITHFKNKDFFKKLFLQILKCIFWWNPFVYLLSNEMNNILEINCDLKVFTNYTNQEKIAYVETIKNILFNNLPLHQKVFKNNTVSYLFNENNKVNIKKRIALLLSPPKKNNVKSSILKITLYTCSLLVFISSYRVILLSEFEPNLEGETTFTLETLPEEYKSLVDMKNIDCVIFHTQDDKYEVYTNYRYQYTLDNYEDAKKLGYRIVEK